MVGTRFIKASRIQAIGFPCTAVLMETRISRFHVILAILLLLACFWLQTEGSFDPERLQRKLVALHKILKYVNKRPQQMNVDLTYGITLTEANLIAAFKHKNVQYLERKLYNTLKMLIKLSDLTRRNLIINVVPRNRNEFFLQSILNYPNLWIRPISWTSISPKMLTPNQKLNYSKIVESLWHGTPNGTESDACLIKIIHNNLNNVYQVPQICIETLNKNNDTTGYPLTHRLLILQMIKAFRLQTTNVVPFSYLVPTYCARILQNLINLEAWDFPNSSRDLITQQILLCGMEGYSEFVNKHYEDLILSWPHSSGCFSSFTKSPKEYKIARRSTRLTDFGCDSHMTGLAAACISIFIRENIENAFS